MEHLAFNTHGNGKCDNCKGNQPCRDLLNNDSGKRYSDTQTESHTFERLPQEKQIAIYQFLVLRTMHIFCRWKTSYLGRGISLEGVST